MNGMRELINLVESIENMGDEGFPIGEIIEEGKLGDLAKVGVAAACIAGTPGCATQSSYDTSVAPVTTGQKEVPSDRQYTSMSEPRENAGILVIRRDKGLLGSGCKKYLYIDGERVADLKAGEGVTLYVTPGEHIISSGWSKKGLCAMSVGKMTERDFVIEPNQTRRYRLSTGGAGDDTIQPTAF